MIALDLLDKGHSIGACTVDPLNAYLHSKYVFTEYLITKCLALVLAVDPLNAG